MKMLLVCFSGWLFYLTPSLALAEDVLIAVASNFAPPMKQIILTFEQETGHVVKSSFGSSGKIYAQIQHGAPFQVFFSADQAKPSALVQAGLAVSNSQFTYAIGGLALWSSKSNVVDSNGEVLKRDYNKLAIANPKLAPYGVAALEVLQNLGIKTLTQPRWVQGENITQTFQFVSSGNADLGFVALSQIMDKGFVKKGSFWIVPPHLYSPIRQDVVLLANGKTSEASKALLEFVRSSQSRALIESYGYQTE
jgi:molybdate transport system substrate-binding protein